MEFLYDSEHISFKNEIQKKIDQLKIESDKMPEQRTSEWLELRKFGFGGSEVSSLLGRNPYRKEINLIRKKIGIEKTFQGNLFTRWGIIQEENTKLLMEIILDTTIEEFNILKGKIDGQLYSPDGIGIVKLKCEGKESILLPSGKTIKRKSFMEYFYTLFEFKAPFSRIPTGKIPKEYIPQVQAGLSVIKDIDNVLFVNALYRICSLKDLGLNNFYNTKFHYGDKNKKYIPKPKPIALGIIVVYQTLQDKKKFENFYEEQNNNEDEYEDEYEDEDEDEDFSDDSEGELDSDLDFGSDLDINDENIVDTTEFFIEDTYNLKMLTIDQIIKLPLLETESLLCESNFNTKKLSENSINNITNSYEMDFGNTNNDILSRLFELITENNNKKYVSQLKIKYLKPFVVNENLWRIEFMYNQDVHIPNNVDENLINKNIYQSFHKQIIDIRKNLDTDNEIIGFIPWKMFDCDIILVDRDPDFITILESKIKKTMNLLHKVNKAPLSEKNIILEKYYENNNK